MPAIPRLPLRRALALALIPLVATGCTTWKTAEVTPQALIESAHPPHVRVTGHDGTRRIVRRPRVAGDSLVGRLGWQGNDSVAVALQDVTRVEVQRVSAVRTAVLVVVLGGMIAGLVAMGSMSGPAF